MNNILKKIFLKFLFSLFIFFFYDFTLCEEILNEEINSNNQNSLNKNIDIDNESEWTFKKIIIGTIISISILGIIYYFFFYGNDSDLNPIINSSLGTIKSISPTPIPIIQAENTNTSMYSFYSIFDFANSVNSHLAQISNDIKTANYVYNSNCIIVNMSNTILNKINWSTNLSLEELKNLPDNQLIAFTHFYPIINDDCYYQIFTAAKLKELIKIYNLTRY